MYVDGAGMSECKSWRSWESRNSRSLESEHTSAFASIISNIAFPCCWRFQFVLERSWKYQFLGCGLVSPFSFEYVYYLLKVHPSVAAAIELAYILYPVMTLSFFSCWPMRVNPQFRPRPVLSVLAVPKTVVVKLPWITTVKPPAWKVSLPPSASTEGDGEANTALPNFNCLRRHCLKADWRW